MRGVEDSREVNLIQTMTKEPTERGVIHYQLNYGTSSQGKQKRQYSPVFNIRISYIFLTIFRNS